MLVQQIHDTEVREWLANNVREMESKLQPDVIRIRSSVGEDWTGNPAIFFRIVLSDAAIERETLKKLTVKSSTTWVQSD